MRKKGRQVFQEKNKGVTPSVASLGVTHPSDATGSRRIRRDLVVYPPTGLRPMYKGDEHPA